MEGKKGDLTWGERSTGTVVLWRKAKEKKYGGSYGGRGEYS